MSDDKPIRDARLSAHQLRARYLIALSLIALLTVVSQIVVQYLIADQEHDSRVINIAGRQRMLSQKIAKSALYAADAPSRDAAQIFHAELRTSLELWQRSHRGLQQGDAELGLPGHNSEKVVALFLRIESAHQAMVKAVQSLLNVASDPAAVQFALESIRANEPDFLSGMDAIVFLYDSEAKDKVALARWLELGLMAVTLLVLLLEAVYIFSPATRRIEEDVRDLADREVQQKRSFQDLQKLTRELDEAKTQLLQADKMAAVGQLAAGVAHEINNPLGFVRSNLTSLRKYIDSLLNVVQAYGNLHEHFPVDDPRRERVERSLKLADVEFLQSDVLELLTESDQGLSRIRKIVLGLKDFSQVDHALWHETNLNESLDATLEMAWPEIKHKLEVVKQYADLPDVYCVEAQINQVLMNLLINAAQAIESHGVVTLSTGVKDDKVWIEIRDSGLGMEDEVCKRIFEPFYTTRPLGQGTGLGLSMAWDIVVKTHHGSIEVQSTVGRGTAFTITLPLRPPGGPAENAA